MLLSVRFLKTILLGGMLIMLTSTVLALPETTSSKVMTNCASPISAIITGYLNSFDDNAENVSSSDFITFWQSEQEIPYLYQDASYSGFLGNFYSNHDLTDSDGDGVTDLAKDQPGIDTDDNYPLAMRHDFFITTFSDMDFDEDVDGLDIAIFGEALATAKDVADLN